MLLLALIGRAAGRAFQGEPRRTGGAGRLGRGPRRPTRPTAPTSPCGRRSPTWPRTRRRCRSTCWPSRRSHPRRTCSPHPPTRGRCPSPPAHVEDDVPVAADEPALDTTDEVEDEETDWAFALEEASAETAAFPGHDDFPDSGDFPDSRDFPTADRSAPGRTATTPTPTTAAPGPTGTAPAPPTSRCPRPWADDPADALAYVGAAAASGGPRRSIIDWSGPVQHRRGTGPNRRGHPRGECGDGTAHRR